MWRTTGVHTKEESLVVTRDTSLYIHQAHIVDRIEWVHGVLRGQVHEVKRKRSTRDGNAVKNGEGRK